MRFLLARHLQPFAYFGQFLRSRGHRLLDLRKFVGRCREPLLGILRLSLSLRELLRLRLKLLRELRLLLQACIDVLLNGRELSLRLIARGV